MEVDLQFPRPVPKVAYLPPFAGFTDKEPRTSGAVRNRLIAQGLAGGVINAGCNFDCPCPTSPNMLAYLNAAKL